MIYFKSSHITYKYLDVLKILLLAQEEPFYKHMKIITQNLLSQKTILQHHIKVKLIALWMHRLKINKVNDLHQIEFVALL